jgi:hypothetical protein
VIPTYSKKAANEEPQRMFSMRCSSGSLVVMDLVVTGIGVHQTGCNQYGIPQL